MLRFHPWIFSGAIHHSDENITATGAFAAYTEMANRPDEYFFSQGMLKYEKNSAFGATADPTVQAYLLGDYTEEECLEILDDFWAEVIE